MSSLARSEVLTAGDLARVLRISPFTMGMILRRVDLKPFIRTKNGRAFWLRAHLPLLMERIYTVEHSLRPSTLSGMLNGVAGKQLFGPKDFKRVDGRWVLR